LGRETPTRGTDIACSSTRRGIGTSSSGSIGIVRIAGCIIGAGSAVAVIDVLSGIAGEAGGGGGGENSLPSTEPMML